MPTVTGNIKQLAGTSITSGQVVFTATKAVVQNREAKTTTLGDAPHVVAVGSSGAFSTSIPATATDWVYEVEVTAHVNSRLVDTVPTLLLVVPEAGADLSEATEKDSEAGRLVVRRMVSMVELESTVNTATEPIRAAVEEARDAATASRDSAYRAEATVGEYDPLIKGILAMAGLTPEDPTDGQTSALVANPASLTGKAARKVADTAVDQAPKVSTLRTDVDTLEDAREDLTARLSVFEQRTPEAYGAAGHDVDSTAAILAWMQAGWSTLPPVAYRLDSGLSLTRHNLKLVGNGATLIVHGNDSPQSRVLSITGDNVEVSGLNIQAATGARLRGGFYVYGDAAKIQNNRIQDLVSEIESRAIHVEGNGGHLISGNRIHNVSATGNLVDGDGNGMARGIVVYHRANATLPSIVSGNHVTDITGEEGDGIAVLASDGSGTAYLSSKTAIVGNTVDNCSRRSVKVQGHDVDVFHNSLRDSKRQMFGKEASAINAYASGRLAIKGNTIWYTDLGASINIQGGALGTVPQDLTISDNSVYGDTGGTSTGIYVDSVSRAIVSGNDVRGGFRGISLGNVSSGAITGNTIERLTAGTNVYACSASDNCTRVAMTNNTDLSVNVYQTFRNASTNGITANNHQILA